MLVFKVAALVLVLVSRLAKAQLTIHPNVIYEANQPVCVTLGLDMYTWVQVREETSIKINCSFVRSSFIAQNSITDDSRVSIRWLFAGQCANLVDFMRPAIPLPTIEEISIRGYFNEIVNNSGVRLPTLAVDGTTGEYTCEVCSDRGMLTENCVNSTVPFVGRRYPPVIDEGGFCITTLALYNNIVICNIGKNFCITSVPSILQITLICQHKPPPTPVTPDPQIGVWFLNGIQISSNNGFGLPAAPSSFTFTEQGRRLTITNLISGNYTCMLTNIAGSDVATTFIDCVPPMLQSPRRDNLSTIQIGFTPHCLTTPQTTILCEVQSGSPVILYRWTKNGVALSETNDRLIVNETGSYQCTARNHYGNDTASTQVTVVSMNARISGRVDNGCSRLTSPSARSPDICVFIGETLEFTCNHTGEDSQITNPGGMTVKAPLTVTNVQPSSDGLFRCTNQCGATSMTIDVQVFAQPEDSSLTLNYTTSTAGVSSISTTLQVMPTVVQTSLTGLITAGTILGIIFFIVIPVVLFIVLLAVVYWKHFKKTVTRQEEHTYDYIDVSVPPQLPPS